jgi:hypothetical protein
MDREDSMEAAKDLREKRKHPRVNMELPLEYRVSEAPNLYGAMVVNVSESGLLIHSVKDLPIGTKLNIAVLFPKGLEFSNFEVLAEIVWKDTYLEENREKYQFGLKFVLISEEDQQKLKQLLGDRHEI